MGTTYRAASILPPVMETRLEASRFTVEAALTRLVETSHSEEVMELCMLQQGPFVFEAEQASHSAETLAYQVLVLH